ncbi:MAG: succinate dehydrogenase/fumarate reductase cytochrome b subunit [Desulfovibrionales bacterium]|nr:succinate dehydrogenase/fumarate reductase cytochrome b subunit [Desulfovibrionales bacterium]
MSVDATMHIVRPGRRDAYLDWIQMLTGAGLVLFIAFHTLLTASIIFGAEALDTVAGFLETLHLDTLAHFFVPLLFFTHFIVAIRKIPVRSNGQLAIWRDAALLRHRDTWLWIIQAVSAMIILLMGAIHMWTNMNDGAILAATSTARVQSGGWTFFYLLLIPLVQVHVFIGVYRIGVKWGFITDATRAKMVKILSIIFGCVTALALIALTRYATMTL